MKKSKSKLRVCDELWSKLIKIKANGHCERCNKSEYIAAHHVIPRTNFNLRHDPENGVALCTRCHIYFAHKDAIGFIEWFKSKFGQQRIDHLELKRNINIIKRDYGLIEIYLKETIKQLGEQ